MVTYCEKCGHAVEYHDAELGCDVEVSDHGDLDCGCREYPKPKPLDASALIASERRGFRS